jgi:glycerol-3-phosphate dehydrogenase
LPTIEQKGLINGVIYQDGQFDDSRLAINIAQTAVEKGACILNYTKVVNLLKTVMTKSLELRLKIKKLENLI